MSPGLLAIIGVGVSTVAFLSGLSGLLFYLFSQVNRRMDRLEDRIDRLEDKVDDLQTQAHSIHQRLAKVEWIVGAEFRQRPEPPDAEAG